MNDAKIKHKINTKAVRCRDIEFLQAMLGNIVQNTDTESESDESITSLGRAGTLDGREMLVRIQKIARKRKEEKWEYDAKKKRPKKGLCKNPKLLEANTNFGYGRSREPGDEEKSPTPNSK
jgi:hypothetical protein